MKSFEDHLFESVEVTGHDVYKFTHGRKPSGKGKWHIGVGIKEVNHDIHKEGHHYVSHDGSLNDAVHKAKKLAHERGLGFVHIMT